MEFTKDELKVIMSKFDDTKSYIDNTELYYKIREALFRKSGGILNCPDNNAYYPYAKLRKMSGVNQRDVRDNIKVKNLYM